MIKTTTLLWSLIVSMLLLLGAACAHHKASTKSKDDTSWCTGLCKTYQNMDQCVKGEQSAHSKRENEAKAECAAASTGCYPSGCWK